MKLDTYQMHRMMYSLTPDTTDRIILGNRHRNSQIYITREFDDEERPYFVMELSECPGLSITFDSVERQQTINSLGLDMDDRFMGRLRLDYFMLIEYTVNDEDLTPEDSE